jgi:putative ABC transport system permease protein
MMQLGLRDALYHTATMVHDHLRGDVFLISPHYEYLLSTRQVSHRRLHRTLGIDGVAGVSSLYVGIGAWKNPIDGAEKRVLVMGFAPTMPVFDFGAVQAAGRELRDADVVLFDAWSRPEFGPIDALLAERPALWTEINGHRTRIAGTFPMGPTFGTSGHVITTDLNFLRLFPARPEGVVDIGLVTLEPGAAPQQVRDAIDAALPEDVRVLTRQQFLELEQRYWTDHLPIGFIFNLGSLLGLVVGGVIVYQILYADVIDHLPEYATLKAMGYLDRDLFAIVVQEALYLSCFGFVPGFVSSLGLYWVLRRGTGILVEMTWERAVSVFALTLVTCLLAGGVAMRKIRHADPASVF